MSVSPSSFIAVIGAGPAGLMAADRLASAGLRVEVFERMASPARKLLMAGRGGLNLTHSEDLERFLGRYHPAEPRLAEAVRAFPPEALRAFVEELGEETFVGSSGRVFPRSFKASPLLRAWLRRLSAMGVVLHSRHHWTGWTDDGALAFSTPDGAATVRADATVLALGGASWPRLGGDGGWAEMLRARGVEVRPFTPANMGLLIPWSEHLRAGFAGAPLKRIALSCGGQSVRGEAVISAYGLEGGAVYAISRAVRAALEGAGTAELTVDLRPDLTVAELERRLTAAPARQSLSTRLRKAASLAPAAVALLRETGAKGDPAALAHAIKATVLTVTGIAGLERAISSAGGIGWEGLDAHLMLRAMPGVFACGEMMDWEAPTGGYLLQACFATGRAAAEGVKGRLGDGARADG